MWSCTRIRRRGRARTLLGWPRRGTTTIARFIGASRGLCCRAGIRRGREREGSRCGGSYFRTKFGALCITTPAACFPWRTRGRAPTPASFSSSTPPQNTWIRSTPCLVSSWEVWTLSATSSVSRPTLATAPGRRCSSRASTFSWIRSNRHDRGSRGKVQAGGPCRSRLAGSARPRRQDFGSGFVHRKGECAGANGAYETDPEAAVEASESFTRSDVRHRAGDASVAVILRRLSEVGGGGGGRGKV
mmetsp:Transcript_20809/g.55575  ORF Transcript_20809/g.55575 Transcript_20809/m.55575 type:complete len:245 (+) Transcript_20809:172-906(+)